MLSNERIKLWLLMHVRIRLLRWYIEAGHLIWCVEFRLQLLNHLPIEVLVLCVPSIVVLINPLIQILQITFIETIGIVLVHVCLHIYHGLFSVCEDVLEVLILEILSHHFLVQVKAFNKPMNFENFLSPT